MTDVVEYLLEDIAWLSSEDYVQSIEEARKEYKGGKVTKLEDLPWHTRLFLQNELSRTWKSLIRIQWNGLLIS